MKLVTYEVEGETSFGLWRNDGIVDLRKRMDEGYPTLAAMVAAEALEEAAAWEYMPPDHAPNAVRLLKPLDIWGKCFCVGVNYPDRNAEYRDASDAPKYPSLFVRFPESFTGPDAPLIRPPESVDLDYEGEIALVIGRAGRRIDPADWADHVAGFTLAN